jgi:two-component sensor histidine kinase
LAEISKSHSKPAPDLASAVILLSVTPLLLLDGQLSVIEASTSFCVEFGIDHAGLMGRSMFAMGDGEWDVPQLRSLLNATLSAGVAINAYEMDVEGGSHGIRKVVLHAQKLDYADLRQIRLLLAISDVTEARANEKLNSDLIREKDVLLQEVQHRVANSLQIIASVLMVSAHKVQSEEIRGHLQDAHSRVMSFAEVQRQLAASKYGEVKLRAYFSKLCESLAASMIRDRNQVTLETRIDESSVNADTSISLGLLVTELVINALKHAFPHHRQGKIIVAYAAQGDDWTLSVSDDGVGMIAKTEFIAPGLGTSIVAALASKLKAVVQTTPGNPGTIVSIAHTTPDAVAA